MEKYRIRQKEKSGIVLDIGLAYTKIGFAGDNGPVKILRTPDDLFTEFKNGIPTFKDLHNKDKDPFIAYCLSDRSSLERKLETFLNLIFFFELIQKLTGKTIYLCQNYFFPPCFYECLTSLLLNKFEISKVQFLLNNSLPLYLTGQLSGLVVECGYYDTQVTPIYDGFPLMNKLVTSKSSGYLASKYLKHNLLEDNQTKSEDYLSNKDSMSQSQEINQRALPEFSLDFLSLEDIKFKYCKLQLLKQEENYSRAQDNIEEMKNTKIPIQLSSKSTQKIKLSYFSSTSSLSQSLFGKIDADEPNIAYSILQCLSKCDPSVAVKVSQNIVLSGGIASVNGFFPRLHQELMHLLDNNEELKSARYLKQHISFFKSQYPSSTLLWIGASIVSQLNLSDNYSLTLEKFKQNGNKVQDLYGKDYLFMLHTYPQEEEILQDYEDVI